ncbi:ankyrin repeat and LEM domain-containing protein 1 [Caerostris extrusa]|uniref:Ankyrin repeat and LEM domain-containing protein 1 n=1 Tax=Caerostris extrusa TaxID=172846 RepID=A0AAV4NBL6_CAEEX|nr:ankyrin repeat and LEM domain-containing protein 1 [Caerostris extrusa]
MNLTKNINYDIPKDEKQPIFFNNAEANYSSNLNNVTQDRTLNDAAIFSSSEMEFYSSNEREKEIIKVKNPEVVIDTDNESGIMLIEKKFLPLNYSRNDESSYCDCVADDWKACKSQSSCCSLWSNCSSHTNTLILITDDYKKLSNSEIYDKLTAMGDDPGPISETTRDVYLRRLIRLNTGCDTSYSQEVYTFLDGRINLERVRNLIHLMADEFNSLDKKWREGNQRCCFNYFLLDPRVTRNLPLRQKQLTYENTFITFLDALFYVGKGTRGRPYNHLIEAAKAINNDQLKNDKISHILDIWGDGYGVISLHCFNNCIPVEAYTQEACIIEAIGLKNLTNIKNGDYYGAASKWKKSWKRQVGTELLQRALQIFILEGEKQIMPKDIKIR